MAETGSTKPIKCYGCKVLAEFFTKEDNPDAKVVVCPQCGVREDLDVVLESIKQQIMQVRKEELEDSFRSAFSDDDWTINASSSNFSEQFNQASPKFTIDIEHS